MNHTQRMNKYDNIRTMNMDNNYQCILSSQLISTPCSNQQTSVKELLQKSAPNHKDFRSLLEYILFKGAFFNFPATNIYSSKICSNHCRELLSNEANRGCCKLCKPVCKRETTSTKAVRRVSKELALAIWEHGQPEENFAFYDQPICDQCRKYLTSQLVSNEIRSRCDHVFDWLYNKAIVFTPAPSESDDYDDDYQVHIDDQYYSDQTDKLKKFKQFLDEIGFTGRCESTHSYTSLKNRSKRNFRYQVKKIIFHLLAYLAPNDAQTVWDDIVHHYIKDHINENDLDKAMIALNTAIENAEHYSTKKQLLAIVAADLPSATLRTHFPTVTDYQIKAARSHAYRCGRGAPVELGNSHIERYNEQQVSHFFEFLLSPSITSDLPFGIKSIKMATGETIEVPNTCRNMIPTRIIRQYQSYCFETTNGNFQPLGSTSLMAILNSCPASTRKSMAGIDEYSANGTTAFESLSKLCVELSTYDVPIDEISQLQKALQEACNYIKIDYKMHVSTSSTIPDHCSTFALSDPEAQVWQSLCDHTHDDQCQQCLLLDTTLARIESIIESNRNISVELRTRFLKSFTQESSHVRDWKKHQLRTVHQEAARDDVLEHLDEKSVYIVVDWAMKWLEKKYRQSQTDFFALRGLPWHLTHVVRLKPSHQSIKTSEKIFQNRTFCHSFDNCIQNGETVVSILQDVLVRLKRDHPEIEVAFLRADNAGCYHGAETLLAVKKLYETTGVLIRRVDFSEAQAGKGPCDRKAAVIKGEIRRYVDEKHNCTTSAEFIAAAKSTHHLTILSCSLPASKQKTTKIKWDDIKKYNNIEFIPKTSSTFDIQSAASSFSSPAVASSSSSTTTTPFSSSKTPSFSSPAATSSSSSTTTPFSSSSKSSFSSPAVTSSSSSTTTTPFSSSTTSSFSSPAATSSFSSPAVTSSSSSTTTTPFSSSTTLSKIELEIKTWRAFQIGPGKKFQWSDLSTVQTITPLIIDPNAQHFNNEWKSETVLKEETSDEEDGEEGEDDQMNFDDNNRMDTNQPQDDPVHRNGFRLWDCTHERCILQFRRRSDRDNHLDTGKHKFESHKMPLIEKAKLLYKTRLDNDAIQKNLLLNNFDIIQNVDPTMIINTLYQGWGLPSKKIHKRFSLNQREYMIDAYEHGEKTGFKMNPSTLSIEMQYVKVNDQFRFSPEEWLTSKQIKSFFSTLTQNRRKSSNSVDTTNVPSQKKVSLQQISNSTADTEPNIEELKLILGDTEETSSYIENIHQLEESISDSNFQNDSDDEDEEENEGNFDARMVVLDMEDMLATAKDILIHK